MDCKATLMKKLDAPMLQGGGLPLWNCDPSIGSMVAAMRVSGFKSHQDSALVFEEIQYSAADTMIECLAFCIATFAIPSFVAVSEAAKISLDEMADPETDEFKLDFGTLEVTSRGKKFEIVLDKKELIVDGFMPKQAKKLTPETLLFKVSETVPRDWLFSEPDHLKKLFDMPSNVKKVFVVEEWEHPSMDEVIVEEMKPSTMPDLIALVEAVCTGNSKPELKGKPNTSWRVRCPP